MVQALVRFQCLLLKILAKAGIQIQINISIKPLKTKKMKKELLSLIKSFEHLSQFEAMNMLLSYFYNYHMITMDELNELSEYFKRCLFRYSIWYELDDISKVNEIENYLNSKINSKFVIYLGSGLEHIN
jgi:hypothetical protein